MTENHPLKLVSNIYELQEVNEFMDDEFVTRALNKLTSMLANPDPPSVKVAKQIIECQSLSAMFAVKAKYYMGIGKHDSDAGVKKNVYMTLKESFKELADALKYLQKAGD